jgi:hypothetical protein
MPEPHAGGPFIRQNFLAPVELMKTLAALDRLSSSWAPSQELRLLGRGQTSQVRGADIAVQAQLDVVRSALAPAALAWAKACGFWFPKPPRLQLFPVRMFGDKENPAYQEPHVDSVDSEPDPPICANVFYARARAIEGGELVVAARRGGDLTDPVVVRPTPNMLVSFAGDRLHTVRPLFAGERLSVVINFY